MKKRTAPSQLPLPTEAELEILNVLWDAGPSTVRDVYERSARDIGYTTILKQMQIMAEKGLLNRSERFRSHVYAPRIAREKTQQRLAGNLLERAFGGSTKELVLGALSAQRATAKELAEIRELLDRFEKRQR